MIETCNQFDALSDEIISCHFKRNPETATSMGIHDYDTECTDFSRSAIETYTTALNSYLQQLDAINFDELDDNRKFDYRFVRAELVNELVHLEKIKPWRLSPLEINDVLNWGVFECAKRNFAPLEERVKSATARLSKIPERLEQAKTLLTEPSELPMNIAIKSFEDSLGFFGNTLPFAFGSIKDSVIKSAFFTANQKALDAYREFIIYLKKVKSIPKSDWKIGADNYSAKLRAGECLDLPLDKVWQIGKDELQKLSQSFDETARMIDSKKTAEEVFIEISKEHPSADELIPFTESLLESIRQFCLDSKIVTIPSDVRCTVAPTPEFMRELTFASMDTPGPFETSATEAYFNVTPPEPSWSEADTEQHMRMYNRYTLIATSIHEAYPGHYVQFLWAKQFPSKIRQVFSSYSNVEGWAHYTEQMMMEQGYLDGNLKLKLAQTHEALLRACRYVAAIGLHTGEFSFEQAVDLFVKQGRMERLNAERECRRGIIDPMYCNYTLGKLLLIKLRDDVKAKQKNDFNLCRFHDEFLQYGPAPIPIIRDAMLGIDDKAAFL